MSIPAEKPSIRRWFTRGRIRLAILAIAAVAAAQPALANAKVTVA